MAKTKTSKTTEQATATVTASTPVPTPAPVVEKVAKAKKEKVPKVAAPVQVEEPVSTETGNDNVFVADVVEGEALLHKQSVEFNAKQYQF